MKKKLSTRNGIVLGIAAIGVTLGTAGLASATTTHHAAPTAVVRAHTSNPTPPNPADLTHGPGETLLTGSNLISADQAATAAVPGATIVRAETNASGASAYEVHMRKSDGSYVTVELDSSFNVVATIDGFGAGPAGQPAPSGQPGQFGPGTGAAPSALNGGPAAA